MCSLSVSDDKYRDVRWGYSLCKELFMNNKAQNTEKRFQSWSCCAGRGQTSKSYGVERPGVNRTEHGAIGGEYQTRGSCIFPHGQRQSASVVDHATWHFSLRRAGRCQLLCCCVAGSSDLYIEAEAAGEDASGDI